MTQPIRPDEIEMRKAIISAVDAGERLPIAREIAQSLGINMNRAYYLCTKWDEKGWWEWGVNPLSGWLTDAGEAAFRESLATKDE